MPTAWEYCLDGSKGHSEAAVAPVEKKGPTLLHGRMEHPKKSAPRGGRLRAVIQFE